MQAEIIYGLTREDGTIFYVGRTRQPNTRLYNHRRRFGPHVQLVVLQDLLEPNETSRNAERRWILKLTPAGNLLNVTHAKPPATGEAALNFSVPGYFKREFKMYALQHGMSMTELLIAVFDRLKTTSPLEVTPMGIDERLERLTARHEAS